MKYLGKFNEREMRLKILNNLWFIPDRAIIKLEYRMAMHKKLDFKNLVSFNEKLQWLKLNDRNPLHTQMVDKYRVRDVVKELIGEEYLVPLLGKWDTYQEIDFSKLPKTFVLKCNHDSGSVKIVMDKDKIDHKEFNEFFSNRLKNNPYRYGREWPYKNVKPCIIAEQYIGTDDGVLPIDYKFFCFKGYVDCVMVCTGRGYKEKRFFFFDKEWKLRKYNYSSQELDDSFQIEKPKEMDELFELASKLSVNEQFVRIDFYVINGHPYFGEFTFFPASGFDNNLLPWADEYLGKFISIGN